MTLVDYAIAAIVGVSALISVFRGFLREAIALLGWIAAGWTALSFSEPVAGVLSRFVETPSVRMGVAFAALFVGVLLVTALVLVLVRLLVDSTGLTGTDRMLGVVFGAARGALIVGVLVLLAGLTSVPRDPWWRASALLPHFEQVALEIRELLPTALAEHLRYPAVRTSGVAERGAAALDAAARMRAESRRIPTERVD